MSPSLAILLTVGLCAYAYYRDWMRSEDTSPALWIATLWMMRCASRGLDMWLGYQRADLIEEGGRYDQILLLCLALAGYAVLFKRLSQVTSLLRYNIPILALFVYLAVSVTWSPVFSDSYKKLFRASGDLTMALIIATEANPMQATLAVLRRSVILLIPLSVVVAKYYPSLGRMPEKHWEPDSWVGVATHKNTLGQISFLAGMLLLVELFNKVRDRRATWFTLPFKSPLEMVYLALTLYLLNAGGNRRSVTSILILVIGIGLFFLMEIARSRPRLVLTALAVTVMGFGVLELGSQAIFGESLKTMVLRSQGRDETLTGRTSLWRDVVNVANKHPILGTGLGGFWTAQTREYFKSIPDHTWGPGQAHNGYIETYAQLGLAGLALLAWVMLSGLSRSLRLLSDDFDYNRFRFILLIAAAIHNYAEAGFPRPTHLVWLTFLIVSLNPIPSWFRKRTEEIQTEETLTEEIRPRWAMGPVASGREDVEPARLPCVI